MMYEAKLKAKILRLPTGQYTVEEIGKYLDLPYESVAVYLDKWHIPKVVKYNHTFWYIKKKNVKPKEEKKR